MPSNRPILRTLVALLGFACVALGIIGALVPLMPSTVFVISAGACFAYVRPRIEASNRCRIGSTLARSVRG